MSLPPFESVFTEHGALVLRICRSTLAAHDAEDAAAETFVAALVAYPYIRPDSDVRAWLVTIAHHKTIDSARRSSRRAMVVDELPDRAAALDADSTSGESELFDAVRALPDKQRRAVAYHHVAGLAYRDVAALLGTSEAAARRSAADGIRALRAKPWLDPAHLCEGAP